MFSEVDKTAWRWFEYDRLLSWASVVIDEYGLDPALFEDIRDAVESDDREKVQDAGVRLLEAYLGARDYLDRTDQT
jgi:hypothetical protein